MARVHGEGKGRVVLQQGRESGGGQVYTWIISGPFAADATVSDSTHRIARSKIAEIFNIPVSDLPLSPRIWGDFVIDHSRYHLSLSHCDDKGVCAFASFPVGIDIEVIEDGFLMMETARQLFSKEELEWLESLEEDAATRLFHQLWTLKEAFFKASGLPFTDVMEHAVFKVGPQGQILFNYHSLDSHSTVSETDWQFSLAYPSPQHIMALAAKTNQRFKIYRHDISYRENIHG